MVIPNDKTLQREILAFLASEPNSRATIGRVCEQLAPLHPELTVAEMTEKYRNSAHQWRNRVQFARLHLANQGFIYKAKAVADAQRGYWKLTPEGLEKARSCSLEFKCLMSEESLESQVISDLESLSLEESMTEGQKTMRLVTQFERNPKLRAAAIKIHGTTCKACGFNFEVVYGLHGKNYIEVHHLVPVSSMTEVSSVDPKNDMTVFCSNCHRMVHRKQNSPLSEEDLKKIVDLSTFGE